MENKFLLATATTWNYEKTKPVFDFITNGINVLFDYEPLRGISFGQYYNDKSGELKDFSLKVFNAAEINIDGYNVSNVEIPEEQLSMMPPQLRAFFPKGTKSFNVTTSHNIVDDKGNERSINLDLGEESLGTQNMFILSSSLNTFTRFIVPILRAAFAIP